MGVALAATWWPRGELPRWRARWPQVVEVYERVVVAIAPEADASQVAGLAALPGAAVVRPSSRPEVRHVAVQGALETAAGHLHFCDGDRLLHWMEKYPEEWRRAVAAVARSDCLVLGRTEQALATHPQALQQTERLFNAVFSHFLGQPLDLGGGSRGFSQRAAQAVLANSAPESFPDAEWPVLAHRAGFAVDYLAVDGLDWETPDHHQQAIASLERQREIAESYDQDAGRWAMRVRLALAIVEAGLAAMERPLREP